MTPLCCHQQQTWRSLLRRRNWRRGTGRWSTRRICFVGRRRGLSRALLLPLCLGWRERSRGKGLDLEMEIWLYGGAGRERGVLGIWRSVGQDDSREGHMCFFYDLDGARM